MSEREILFRGKRVDNEHEWVYGDYHNHSSEKSISFYKVFVGTPVTMYAVIPETVGQYTGLTDKNGTRIFEGDIIDVAYNPNYGGVAKERIGVRKVGFADGCYMYEDNEGYFLFTESDEVTVIGNIHDNPELLKGD